MMDISVATYTRNRAELLAQALESLCHQTMPSNRYEIIVVDNGSTDDTHQVVEQFAQKNPQVRYFYEAKTGSSAARNRGWKEAVGKYVAFIDDDGKAPPGWLEAAESLIRTRSPDVMGGPVYPFYSLPPPAWFKDEYNLATNGDQARPLAANEYLSGSNLIVHRALFTQFGGFDENLGMAGSQIGYGEETAFLNQLRIQYPAALIYYDPALLSYHLVRPEKYSLAWQLRSHFMLGRDNYLAYSAGVYRLTARHFIAFVALSFLIVYQATLGVALRNRSRYPYAQNYYFERLFHSLARWSRHCERFRQNFSVKASK